MVKRSRKTPTTLAAIAIAAILSLSPARAMQQSAAATRSRPTTGVVIRGCLAGSKLTHIDPLDSELTLPDTLRVSTIRVIRGQLKTLNGHEVELIGTVRGLPDQDNGLLVADSDKGRLYIGGGDPKLGQDLNTARNDPPSMHAHTIKDIAPVCNAGQPR